MNWCCVYSLPKALHTLRAKGVGILEEWLWAQQQDVAEHPRSYIIITKVMILTVWWLHSCSNVTWGEALWARQS